jgi:hypothetical protein
MIPEMKEHFEGVTGKQLHCINMKTDPAIKNCKLEEAVVQFQDRERRRNSTQGGLKNFAHKILIKTDPRTTERCDKPKTPSIVCNRGDYGCIKQRSYLGGELNPMTLIKRRGIHLPLTKGKGQIDVGKEQKREAQGGQTTPFVGGSHSKHYINTPTTC